MTQKQFLHFFHFDRLWKNQFFKLFAAAVCAGPFAAVCPSPFAALCAAFAAVATRMLDSGQFCVSMFELDDLGQFDVGQLAQIVDVRVLCGVVVLWCCGARTCTFPGRGASNTAKIPRGPQERKKE